MTQNGFLEWAAKGKKSPSSLLELSHLAPDRQVPFPNLTEQAVIEALAGFELPLAEGWNMHRLTYMIRDVLIRTLGFTPSLRSAADQIAELKKATEAVEAAHEALASLSLPARAELFFDVPQTPSGVPENWPQFAAAADGIEWLAVFLRARWGATTLPSQPKGRWKTAEERQHRDGRAWYLSAVFESAFGREATWNDWPSSQGGPWADFYRRIVKLAFGPGETTDLRGTLKRARALSLQNPGILHSII
ncbi:hypothetical protein [Sphingomonas oligoaromativorans]|uniref:hypothetical protein n=1 Tax=Sphingomonas oligoaromativorans TaxID=575322 RepID=UPI00141FBBFE|nr:hypothetical protein [Sphingomonas oligoaromativorans]NIJ32787.1 hypothetical protein [Sphingomonas oligoaromativorans]